jgi:hypothetical protein
MRSPRPRRFGHHTHIARLAATIHRRAWSRECRRQAGPAAPNQRRSALSSSSSNPSAPPQPSRTVARPPDRVVAVQVPP